MPEALDGQLRIERLALEDGPPSWTPFVALRAGDGAIEIETDGAARSASAAEALREAVRGVHTGDRPQL